MTFTPSADFGVDLRPDGRIRTTCAVRWAGNHGDHVDIPAGTLSDGATRPWATAAVVDQWGPATRAFLVHDVLCEALRTWWEARRRWEASRLPTEGADVGRIAGLPEVPEPVPPAFDAVDTDAVLRLILRDLGTGPVLAGIYWAGVRWAALFSPWRRAGWWRPRVLAELLAWTPLVALIVGPAAVGALVSRVLLALAETLARPFTRRSPRARGRVRRRGAVLGDGPVVGPCLDCRAGCPMLGGPCSTDLDDECTRCAGASCQACDARKQPEDGDALDLDGPDLRPPAAWPQAYPTPCPPGTHSNTGTAADEEIAACPRCNPNQEDR